MDDHSLSHLYGSAVTSDKENSKSNKYGGRKKELRTNTTYYLYKIGVGKLNFLQSF